MFDGFDPTIHCSSGGVDEWSQLHVTAQKFLNDLNLSTSHPLCHNETIFSSSPEFIITKLEDLPEDLYYERHLGLWNQVVTNWCKIAPALLAMSELWLRLFAFILAPLIILFVISRELRQDGSEMKKKLNIKEERKQALLLIVGLASCLVLLTDTMYVHASDGRQNGARLFLLMIILTISRCKKLVVYRKMALGSLFVIIGLALYLIAHSDKQGTVGSYDYSPGLDVPTIKPGLYYSKENKLMSKIAEIWPIETRTYDVNSGATPYLLTGDSLTGIPFLVNEKLNLSYHRVWVQNAVDNEAVALDIKFPVSGVHSTDKPIFFILHGLNGGSHEDYVQDFVARRTTEGYTCVVMIARGLMDTPVIGWNVFHGARILDVETAARAVSQAKGSNQLLAGVGYSMGAIVLSNYVARSGADCHLDTAISISGGLDMREMLNFKRSMRLWQPMLAQTLRDEFIVKKFDNRFRHRLTKEEHLKLMRSTSISDIDVHAVVAYNNFNDLKHYYSEMSAMGDSDAFLASTNSVTSSNEVVGRIANVSIPFCVLHALDDPLTSWRTVGHDPVKLADSGSGNIMILLTKSGGHVGWPLSMNPRHFGWKFMNDVALNFIASVDTAKRTT